MLLRRENIILNQKQNSLYIISKMWIKVLTSQPFFYKPLL